MAQEAAASAKERAKALARRAEAEAVSGETGEEAVRQLGLIYGGLIGIAVVMVQPFLAAASLDATAKVSVIAFSVANPLLAALVMVNRQEAFRHRRTPSVSVMIAQGIAQLAAFIGIAAGFWHIDWLAGVAFLAAGFVGVLVHSAGYWRLEENQDRSQGGEP
jgi:tetrahydromethanopterin S-methyltransferase subunit G